MNPAEEVRTMLQAMRARGWPFEKAWTSATQRLRTAPGMDDEQASELAEWKESLEWARPIYRALYEGETAISFTALLAVSAETPSDAQQPSPSPVPDHSEARDNPRERLAESRSGQRAAA